MSKHSKYSELDKILTRDKLIQNRREQLRPIVPIEANVLASSKVIEAKLREEYGEPLSLKETLNLYITKEKAKAERAVVERVKLHKDHPLLSPAKRRDANNTIDYIVADLEAQLTKDKEDE